MNFSMVANSRISLNMGIIGLLLVFVLYAGTCGLSSRPLTESEKRQKIDTLYAAYKKDFPEIRDLSPRQAMKLVREQKVVFIDVREPREQQISMIANAITDKAYLKNPEKYKDYIKIGYCTISYRSGIFVQELQKKGVRVYNLRGGILAWIHDGGKIYSLNQETNRVHVYNSQWNLAPDGYEAVW